MNGLGAGRPLPSKEEYVRREHAIEWQEGWQYAVVFRTLRDLTPEQVEEAKATVPVVLLPPPPGDGWGRNFAIARKGYTADAPAWCKDGTALMQRVHWRRERPGMQAFAKDHKLSFNREGQ